MTKKILALLMTGALALTVGCGANNNENETVNNENNTASVEAEVAEDMKIASGTVAVTNVLDRLEQDLVGVPSTSTVLPERYEGVTEIGMAFAPDFEVIASIDPDLLIFDSNFEDDLKPQADEYGMDTFFFNTGTYGSFVSDIERLATEINKEEIAAELVDELNGTVDSVLERAEGVDAPSVVILFGSSESFMLATEHSYIGDLVNLVGGENVASDLTNIETAYLDLSLEQVIAANPDYVLRFAHGDLEAAEAAYDEQFASNPAWQALDAVEEGRVFDLDPTIFGTSANLGVADAIEELGNILYGDN